MKLLCFTASLAITSPVETTLRRLLDEYGFDTGDDVLLSLSRLNDALSHFQLRCDPPIGQLGLDDRRVLSAESNGALVSALDRISRGETSSTEFKASFLLDWKKYVRVPGLEIAQYRNDDLKRSILKTLAAFANTDGGVLYIGITDDGVPCGLENDFLLANIKRPDYDGWEQYLRSQIESAFYDGRSFNAYVRTELLSGAAREFIEVKVAARSELTFLKAAEERADLFVRSGTRSVTIAYQDIEKHFELRRKF
ncbi:MAG: ATP-binding protein [Rhizobium sp.]|nr:ATP-binding protein [Rhizobium sp.]